MAVPYYDHCGRLLDRRYELTERVGAGAFATVYRASDRNLHGRAVAVKVLHPEHAGDRGTVQRFLREVRLAARITGKHRDRLVQILDQGFCEAAAPGLLYFVMEFVEGPTLQRLLRESEGGALPWRRALTLVHEVCQALVTLHAHGVVHRDIKPGNCILEDDRVRLLDLGIAKLLPGHESTGVARLTLPNMVVGTPRYMAPEQYAGHGCDARADLYAVGVMLYEMLTGGAPVYRDQAGPVSKAGPAVVRPLRLLPPSEVASPREIPRAVDAIALQALQWVPEERYQSARALLAAIESALGDRPLAARSREWQRDLPARQRWLLAAGRALGAWTLVAGTTVATASLAVGVSLAQGVGVADGPPELEHDDSPGISPPIAGATVAAQKQEGAPVVAPAEGEAEEVAASEAGLKVAAPSVGSTTSPGDAAPVGSTTSPGDAAPGEDAAPVESTTSPGDAAPVGSGEDAASARSTKSSGDAAPVGSTRSPGDAAPVGPTTPGGEAPPVAPPTAGAEEPGLPERVDKATFAARFATLRGAAVAECSGLCGLASARGLVARVQVRVRPDGRVRAKAQAPWGDSPFGACLEKIAARSGFEATQHGGSAVWTMRF